MFTAGLEDVLLVDWFVTGVGGCFECRADAIVCAWGVEFDRPGCRGEDILLLELALEAAAATMFGELRRSCGEVVRGATTECEGVDEGAEYGL